MYGPPVPVSERPTDVLSIPRYVSHGGSDTRQHTIRQELLAEGVPINVGKKRKVGSRIVGIISLSKYYILAREH